MPGTVLPGEKFTQAHRLARAIWTWSKIADAEQLSRHNLPSSVSF
jgi:hypothetical protein